MYQRFSYMRQEEKDDSYSHILKYTGIFGGVQGLNILMGVVRNKLVALILGPEGLGLISLFNSSIKLLSDSTNLGIGMSAVREISDAYANGDTARTEHVVRIVRMWSILTAVIGALLCVTLSPLLNRWTFSWGEHTLHFMLLSPVVALMAITGGELAILKGTRQLRHLAVISIYGVMGALVTSIPLYLIWHEAAIVPSLVIIAALQAVFTIAYSYRMFPPRFGKSRAMFGEGLGMVRLGVAFVLAGVLGSGAEFAIRSYLNNVAGLSVVGLYNAGFMITMTYAGMVFQAMETDYFPRLSAVDGIGPQLNTLVNRQIEVSLLLVAPLLVLFIFAAPVLLPLLYSHKFTPVMGMAKFTVMAMYFRAVTLPIEYISLAKGRSRLYLCIEAVYDVVLVAAVIVGYNLAGLNGTGVAIAFTGLVNLVFVLLLTHHYYRYCVSPGVMMYSAVLFPLGIVSLAVSQMFTGWVYWTLGGLLTLACISVSVSILHSKSNLWNNIRSSISARLPWRRHSDRR